MGGCLSRNHLIGDVEAGFHGENHPRLQLQGVHLYLPAVVHVHPQPMRCGPGIEAAFEPPTSSRKWEPCDTAVGEHDMENGNLVIQL